MKLSVPRSSAYNLASGTESWGSAKKGERTEGRARELGNTSLYDHCPQCRVLANATSQRYLSSRCRSASDPSMAPLVPPFLPFLCSVTRFARDFFASFPTISCQKSFIENRSLFI